MRRESKGPNGEIVLRLTPVELEALRSALPRWVEACANEIEAREQEAMRAFYEDAEAEDYVGNRIMFHGDEYALIDAAELLHAGQRILESLSDLTEDPDTADHGEAEVLRGFDGQTGRCGEGRE